MHRIVKAHLDSFAKSFGCTDEPEERQFEKFVNYSVMTSKYSSAFDVDEVTTSDADDGIDGVAVVVNEEFALSLSDTKSVFANSRKNNDVDIIFIQAKRSEGFDLGDFLKFKEAVLRFATQSPYLCTDETMRDMREIFDFIVTQVPKVRNGKPSLTARYVTTGVYKQPAAFETALQDFLVQLDELGLFASIDVKFLGRDELTELWVGTYSGTDASLTLFSYAPLPAIAGIDEAYLAVVKASELVQNLLVSRDGNLRTQVFEENVRSFLGNENPVNQSISATLRSGPAASRFPVLNNGITIVSPDIRVQGNNLHLTNFQIVNGCQTSNVLFENKDILEDVMVNIKFVETKSEDVFSELVRATNSQSKVDENQFLSLRPLVKRVEQYFRTYENEGNLYFERRDRQYVGQDIPAVRIFSVHTAARCVAAMYCGRPELAARYPKQMYDELTNRIFADDVREIVFYASCLTMYRLFLLQSNSTIPQNMRRFKWHILPVVRALICGKETHPLSSKKVEVDAQKIINIMAQHGQAATDAFNKVVAICQGLGDVSGDQLRRQSMLSDMLSKLP